MKEDYKYYSDLSKEERKKLKKEVFKENKSIKSWNNFVIWAAGMIALIIAQEHRSLGLLSIIYGFLCYVVISVLLAVVFYRAVVFPQIKEAIERKINSKQNS